MSAEICAWLSCFCLVALIVAAAAAFEGRSVETIVGVAALSMTTVMSALAASEGTPPDVSAWFTKLPSSAGLKTDGAGVTVT